MSDIRRDIVALLPRLRRLAWAVARDEQEAEDLLHLAVEKALASHSGLPVGARLDMWMFRIMKNLWIDQMRKRNRWSRLVTPLSDDLEIGDDGHQALDLLDGIERARLRARVEQLPEDQRLAVKLVLLGGCSYAEAAEVLEVPEGTLTSRLARGRAALLRFYPAEGTGH